MGILVFMKAKESGDSGSLKETTSAQIAQPVEDSKAPPSPIPDRTVEAPAFVMCQGKDATNHREAIKASKHE